MDTYLVEIILNVHVSYFFDVCFGAYNNMILFPNSEKILEVVTVFMTRKLLWNYEQLSKKRALMKFHYKVTFPLRVMNWLEGPPSKFSTFLYRGSSNRRKSVACPKFEIKIKIKSKNRVACGHQNLIFIFTVLHRILHVSHPIETALIVHR